MIDVLHETDEDENDYDSIPKVERQYRKILRLTIGALKTNQIQGTYCPREEVLATLSEMTVADCDFTEKQRLYHRLTLPQ